MKRSEESEQARVVKWSHKKEIRAAMPALRWLYHCPNGGARSAFTGAQMTAMGVKKGQPDLLLPVAVGNFNGLAIEMKSDIGGVTPEQQEWLDHYASQGWSIHVCRSADAAHEILCLYLMTDPPKYPLE